MSSAIDDLDGPALLFKGSDPALLGDAVRRAVQSLVGDADRSLVVDEFDAERYRTDTGLDLRCVVDAASTPPLFTERRVVVARHLGVARIADLQPVLEYLAAPLGTTALVLVWERGPSGDTLAAVPKRLSDAVATAGGAVIDASAARGRDRRTWIEDQLAEAGLVLESGAVAALADHLGEDPGRLPGIIVTLLGAFGPGSAISAEDLTPHLVGAGDVAPWDLTDAIDRGDTAAALDALGRMLGAGRHPLQVMATLTTHVTRMLALDGAPVGDERSAAALLGMKGSTFPAKKALGQSRRLGSARLAEFTQLLARADRDLRGERAIPDEAVMEVLVARLASRSRR